MRLVVDFTRCEGFGQCAFLAPDVFRMRGAEALWDNPEPDDAQRERVLRAAAACPVQAIRVDRIDARDAAATMVSGSAAAAARAKPTPPRPVPPQRAGEPAAAGWRAATVEAFRRSGRIVIVGASLAGLAAAAFLRREGFAGSLTVIGDEPDRPYDRPPLSKQVLDGWIPPDHAGLPHRDEVDAQWRLGVPATSLDPAGKRVLLGDGSTVEYDRLLIATGTRARPWHNEAEAALDGVFTLRTREDAAALRQRLAGRPGRVLVIGAGFTGSEVASACRDQDLPVTVAERGSAPLVGALGGVIGEVAAGLHRDHGVDLRCGVTVTSLDGDGNGQLRRARLSDGTAIDTDVAVVALGAVRNTEWLSGSGLAVGIWGVACDAGCRAVDVNAVTTDDVFVAGDVARFPHPLYDYQFVALEHWGNAVTQAEVAAHNMVSAPGDLWPHLATPVFWSQQFGTNIKSVGVPTLADQVVIAQGSVSERRFVAAYGYRGRTTAAVSFDHGIWLDFYQKMIETAEPFPPAFPAVDQQAGRQPVPAQIDHKQSPHATVAVTGHDPSERRAEIIDAGLTGRPLHSRVTHERCCSHRQPVSRRTVMAQPSIYQQVLDPAHRANPYPLYAELRKTPVTREDDGTYVISTYNEIFALLHDPRVSSDPRNHPGTASTAAGPDQGQPGLPLPFIHRDPPGHDRLRELAMRPFGPPCTPGRVDGMRPWLAEITTGLIDKLADKNRADIVDDFAYPLPVTAICQLLGVPLDDQPRFHQWADALIETIDPTTGTFEQRARKRDEVNAELGEYFSRLADSRARRPGDDLISGLLTDHGPHGPMSREDVLATANLLLVAGHETTVNLITNGMLTLLRHPGMLDRLNHEPGLVITLVEELLRYEPPVQMRTNRVTVADIDIAGTTIPQGSPLALMLAAGNRDPSRFADPDRFDPGRTDNTHFGFFGGIHYCFGAPLARTETQVALPELARRLVNPRLAADPPPYRPNPELRGPRHLLIEYDAVAPARQEAGQAVSPGIAG